MKHDIGLLRNCSSWSVENRDGEMSKNRSNDEEKNSILFDK